MIDVSFSRLQICIFAVMAGLALLGLGETDLARLAFVQRAVSHWPSKTLRERS